MEKSGFLLLAEELERIENDRKRKNETISK
jgi:hypothetical protein